MGTVLARSLETSSIPFELRSDNFNLVNVVLAGYLYYLNRLENVSWIFKLLEVFANKVKCWCAAWSQWVESADYSALNILFDFFAFWNFGKGSKFVKVENALVGSMSNFCWQWREEEKCNSDIDRLFGCISPLILVSSHICFARISCGKSTCQL